MPESYKRPALVIGTVLLLVVAGFWFFWPESMKPPDEARRFRHPAGYSIVLPEHFECRVSLEGTTVHADGLTAYDARVQSFPATLAIQRFRNEPDWKALSNRGFKQKSTFQGHEALIMNGPTGRGPAGYWNYRVVVKFGDEWFEIGVADPTFFDMTSSPWRAFLESFRYEPKAGDLLGPKVPFAFPAPPTTAPAATQPG